MKKVAELFSNFQVIYHFPFYFQGLTNKNFPLSASQKLHNCVRYTQDHIYFDNQYKSKYKLWPIIFLLKIGFSRFSLLL